jgi:hypothetical protein
MPWVNEGPGFAAVDQPDGNEHVSIGATSLRMTLPHRRIKTADALDRSGHERNMAAARSPRFLPKL